MTKDTPHLKRRRLGEHLTPVQVFEQYILPEIREELYHYQWIDLFAGAGNLILPLLKHVPPHEREDFFRERIHLFDVQPEMVEKAVQHVLQYGIPELLARRNIRQQDTLLDYPKFLLEPGLPIYHLTNPPYLYLGYIVKHPETQPHLRYFEGRNQGYQDLYQIALINDLHHGLQRMTYIIPSNFLFGSSGSNKIRDDFLPYYHIRKATILEQELFEHTGLNVVICHFERKPVPRREPITFEGVKVNHTVQKRVYQLDPAYHYRAGSEFEAFLDCHQAEKPLQVKYYLTMEEVQRNPGECPLTLVDANAFEGRGYRRFEVCVNSQFAEYIRANGLFVRTVDTGSAEGVQRGWHRGNQGSLPYPSDSGIFGAGFVGG
jgi:type I restriction-modification system DNA methylase subunit